MDSNVRGNGTVPLFFNEAQMGLFLIERQLLGWVLFTFKRFPSFTVLTFP
jgi:hypothetical protein